jgi:hypothetical protein
MNTAPLVPLTNCVLSRDLIESPIIERLGALSVLCAEVQALREFPKSRCPQTT